MNQRSIEQTVAALGQMTVAQLRDKYLEVFGEPSRSGNRDYLFKKVAWGIQSREEGTLSERARQRARELARDVDVRITMPRPPKPGADAATRTVKATSPRSISAHDRLPIAGTVLTRKYRGRQISVKVLVNGFEYEGKVYRSLSAVAKAVTGSHWNGHLFFRLTGTVAKETAHA